ncbi:hypothetical protein CHS0354_036705 [Potamilus streckersoni]|uniref:Uncharacterized protein n=1 Tax=Potamilus streckersoni TaxID=2493646 RepID=A0AAE0TDV5_9BIVA|nr:hypothetical protein CHS0354_036705 [Potamilus streckersoni]
MNLEIIGSTLELALRAFLGDLALQDEYLMSRRHYSTVLVGRPRTSESGFFFGDFGGVCVGAARTGDLVADLLVRSAEITSMNKVILRSLIPIAFRKRPSTEAEYPFKGIAVQAWDSTTPANIDNHPESSNDRNNKNTITTTMWNAVEDTQLYYMLGAAITATTEDKSASSNNNTIYQHHINNYFNSSRTKDLIQRQ